MVLLSDISCLEVGTESPFRVHISIYYHGDHDNVSLQMFCVVLPAIYLFS